uniref:NADH dehydrogenase subunit 6 n=1 Tax=Timomenus komarovi TaxID=1301248 RepID=UPI0030FE1F52|nr:NADH dehydrogenase subunit 6 [Timomenus komarovi]
MTKLLSLFLSLWAGVMFSVAVHPLTMGLTLMLQTFSIALFVGLITQTFWLGYVLFLVFLGGMLVLFLYTTSLASNEIFTPSMKFMGMTFSVSIGGWIILIAKGDLHYYTQPNPSPPSASSFYFTPYVWDLQYLYSSPTLTVTLFLAWYLLVTLLVVAKIIDVNAGPLRPSI